MAFAYYDTHRDQLNSVCRDGVAPRPRLLFQVSRWCRDGVALRPMLHIVPTTCLTHAHFEILAQFKPVDVNQEPRWLYRLGQLASEAGARNWKRGDHFLGLLGEELGGRRASIGAWSLQPPFLWSIKLISVWFSCSVLLFLFVLNYEVFVFCDFYWDNLVIDI